MTSRIEIESALQRYFYRKFKKDTEDGQSVLDKYQIVAKPVGIDLNSPLMQDLVMQFRVIYLAGRASKTINLTQIYLPIEQLAEQCREKKVVEELKVLWVRGTIGLSIPDLERCIQSRFIRFRQGSKMFSKSQITYSYQDVQKKLYRIFYYIYSHNDIKVPFSMSDVLGSIGQEEK